MSKLRNAAILSTSLLLACGNGASEDQTRPLSQDEPANPTVPTVDAPGSQADLEFWYRFAAETSGGVEAERFDSLAEMSQAADLVIHGRVAEVAIGREISAESAPQAGTLLFVNVVIEPQTTLSGAYSGQIAIELPVFRQPQEEHGALLDRIVRDLPSGEALFFLRDKVLLAERANQFAELESELLNPDDFQGLYRFVNGSGLIVNIEGTAVLPLRPNDGHSSDGVVVDVGTSQFSDVLERARQSVGD